MLKFYKFKRVTIGNENLNFIGNGSEELYSFEDSKKMVVKVSGKIIDQPNEINLEEISKAEFNTLILDSEQVKSSIFMNNDIAKNYLKDTDWYVSREADSGVKMPAEIKAKRQKMRELIV